MEGGAGSEGSQCGGGEEGGERGGARVPEAPAGSLRLDGHVAGATDARGTAGSRDG